MQQIAAHSVEGLLELIAIGVEGQVEQLGHLLLGAAGFKVGVPESTVEFLASGRGF